jgi:hypothetical protein
MPDLRRCRWASIYAIEDVYAQFGSVTAGMAKALHTLLSGWFAVVSDGKLMTATRAEIWLSPWPQALC